MRKEGYESDGVDDKGSVALSQNHVTAARLWAPLPQRLSDSSRAADI